MYHCIHDYSQEKERFFFYIFREFNFKVYIYMYMYMLHVHILYTFICSHHAKKAHQRLKVYVQYVYV